MSADTASFVVATFNVAWARVSSSRFGEIQKRTLEVRPDLICLTETHDALLGSFYCISSDADYGYRRIEGRRKVVLASRQPWSGVVTHPIDTMPLGRFVSGKTSLSGEMVTVIGVCIPWSAAHVSTGRKDRTRWEDHVAYLDALAEVLPDTPERTILLGDFNQTVPRTRAPVRVHDALEQTILDRFTLLTKDLSFEGRPTIDHIAVSSDIESTEVGAISNLTNGSKLSDHFGVFALLSHSATSKNGDRP